MHTRFKNIKPIRIHFKLFYLKKIASKDLYFSEYLKITKSKTALKTKENIQRWTFCEENNDIQIISFIKLRRRKNII